MPRVEADQRRRDLHPEPGRTQRLAVGHDEQDAAALLAGVDARGGVKRTG